MRRLLPCLLAVALLAACRSDAEKLLDLRTELRTTLDRLYAAYGGLAAPAQAKTEGQSPDQANDGTGPAARIVGEVERAYFESYCLARGRGERPFSLSGKLETFMADSRNEEACRDAARLEVRIQDLEAKAVR